MVVILAADGEPASIEPFKTANSPVEVPVGKCHPTGQIEPVALPELIPLPVPAVAADQL